MNTVWLLVWFVFVPEMGIKYYHLGTYENETFCSTALKDAAVMVNDKNETVECIGVQTDD
jgi:hypothetical protein